MAKTTKEDKPEVVYHASLVTNEQKGEGITYTYDWNKVTDPDHLKARKKELDAVAPVSEAPAQPVATEVKP